MRNDKGQFIKGQSGNPAGRPRRQYEFLSILDDELLKKKKRVTVKQEICRSLIRAALEGDTRIGIRLLEIYENRSQFDVKMNLLERLEQLEAIVNAGTYTKN